MVSHPSSTPVIDEAGLTELFATVDRVFLPRAVAAYAARLVAATHPGVGGGDVVDRYVKFGASPRGAIAIAQAARANALMSGKPNVGFDDVRAIATPALAHRIVLDYQARLDKVDGRTVVANLLESVDEVGEALPDSLVQA